MAYILKSSLMYGSSWDRGFMKNFHCDTICNITQEPQELQKYNNIMSVDQFIDKSAVIK